MRQETVTAYIVVATLYLSVIIYAIALNSPPGPNSDGICAQNSETIVFTEMPGSHNQYFPQKHEYKLGDGTIDIFSIFDDIKPNEDGTWTVHFTNTHKGTESSYIVPDCNL